MRKKYSKRGRARVWPRCGSGFPDVAQRILSDFLDDKELEAGSEGREAVCPNCFKAGIRRGKVRRGGQEVQRYYCQTSGYYYVPDLVDARERAINAKINDYLFGGGSQKYRAREIGKSRQALARRLRKLRDECLDDLGIIREFKPDWAENSSNGGVIAFDTTNPEGSSYLEYLAFDERTGDAVCYMRGGRVESEEDWIKFFHRFDRTGYDIKLIVSDKGLGRCLLRAVTRHYPGKHHQIDWEHEMREILDIMPLPPRNAEEAKRRRRKDYQSEDEQQLYELIVKMRYARKERKEDKDEDAFDEIWKSILQMFATTTKRGRDVILLLQKDIPWLKAHYAADRDVTSSNAAEYGIGRFKVLFLRARKGIHATSPFAFVRAMNLLWAAFRARPMYDSEVARKKDKAPLELARTNAMPNDIWQFMKQRKKDKNTQKCSEG